MSRLYKNVRKLFIILPPPPPPPLKQKVGGIEAAYDTG